MAPWRAPHFSKSMAGIWGIPEDYHVKPPAKVTMKLSTFPPKKMFKLQNQQIEQNARRRQVVEAQGPPQRQYICESLLRGSEIFRRAAVALMPAVFKKAASLSC